MQKIIYIALDLDGTVLAHFMREKDCSNFCEQGVKYTHIVYNLDNRDGAPAPPGWHKVQGLMYLNHITLSTGHIARTQRSDVAPQATKLLAGWLPSIVDSGQIHPLPVQPLSHFGAQAFVQDGALVVTACAPVGPHTQGKPHGGQTMPLVTFGVATRSRQGGALWSMLTCAFDTANGLKQPDTPFCAVAIHPSIANYTGPVEWLGDFERCVAWAWITRNPKLIAI